MPGELPCGFARAEGRDFNPWEGRGALRLVSPEQGRTQFLGSVLTVAGMARRPNGLKVMSEARWRE